MTPSTSQVDTPKKSAKSSATSATQEAKRQSSLMNDAGKVTKKDRRVVRKHEQQGDTMPISYMLSTEKLPKISEEQSEPLNAVYPKNCPSSWATIASNSDLNGAGSAAGKIIDITPQKSRSPSPVCDPNKVSHYYKHHKELYKENVNKLTRAKKDKDKLELQCGKVFKPEDTQATQLKSANRDRTPSPVRPQTKLSNSSTSADNPPLPSTPPTKTKPTFGSPPSGTFAQIVARSPSPSRPSILPKPASPIPEEKSTQIDPIGVDISGWAVPVRVVSKNSKRSSRRKSGGNDGDREKRL
jgi:hypothetical protein